MEERGSPRRDGLWPLSLQIDGQTWSGDLLEFSAQGMRARVQGRLAHAGAQVTVSLPSKGEQKSFIGNIVWSRASSASGITFVGIRFVRDHALDFLRDRAPHRAPLRRFRRANIESYADLFTPEGASTRAAVRDISSGGAFIEPSANASWKRNDWLRFSAGGSGVRSRVTWQGWSVRHGCYGYGIQFDRSVVTEHTAASEPKGEQWVFTYGSSMNLDSLLERARAFGCERSDFLLSRPATLQGYELCWNYFSNRWSSGAANIVAAPGKSLPGVVFKVSEPALRAVDEEEGHPTRRTRGDLPLSVSLSQADGTEQIVSAWVYSVQLYMTNEERVEPSSEYVGIMREGARLHGINPSYITHSLRPRRAR